MSDYNGEDLLNVFNDLNIRLLNLNPNVIKAWFDTDDQDMINLLTWMCASLSKKNYVSPLENAEFLELETPLVNEKYERELKSIADEYPGIFDVELNSLETEFIEDEIELLLEEEKHIDELMRMNKILQTDLSKELTFQTSREIETSLKVGSAQELCNSLAEKLDDINGKLHTQLAKYGSNLYDFEFGSVPHFISNMDIKEIQENFENIASFLIPVLESEFLPVNTTGLENHTHSDLINTNNSIANSLNTMRNRILHSHQNYLVSKIEAEKLKGVLSYLCQTNIDSIMALSENAYMQITRENKEETKRRMCGMLDNICTKFADQHITQIKLKYAQQELELYQTKLKRVKKIEDTVLKCLSQYCLLNLLFVQEKNDFDTSDKYFRKILHYIGKELKSCAVRTEKMEQIINQYNDYTSKSTGERYKMIKSVIKVLSDEKEFSLNKALEVMSEFKNELSVLENKLFCSDFGDYKAMGEKLRKDVSILQSFLVCGPTHRVVVVPSELQNVFQEVEEHLKKQAESVKSAVEISRNMKKITSNKWLNYRRQLWMYFYTDPQKLFFIIQQIEEEFKRRKLNGIQIR